MLQAHKTCPCSLLLESWFLLLSVPTSMLLFSSQLFSCSVNLKWLHSTPSLRCNCTTLSTIMLLPQANGNWPHLSMGDLQVSIHQKYTIAERQMWKDVSWGKKSCTCCSSLPKSKGCSISLSNISCKVVHGLTPGCLGGYRSPVAEGLCPQVVSLHKAGADFSFFRIKQHNSLQELSIPTGNEDFLRELRSISNLPTFRAK